MSWMSLKYKAHKFVVFSFCSLFLSCSHRISSPMEDRLIPITQRLVVGLFNLGSTFDSSALETCKTQYLNFSLAGSPDVHRSLRDAQVVVNRVITPNLT